MSYQTAITDLSPDGYWPLDDASGTVAGASVGSNGTYGDSGSGTTEQRTINYQAGSITPAGGGDSVSFGGWVSGSSFDQSPMATQCHAKLPTSMTAAGDFCIVFTFEMPDHTTETQTGSNVKRPLLSINEDSNSSDRSLVKVNTADLFYSLGTYVGGLSVGMSDTTVGAAHQFVVLYTASSNTQEFYIDGASINSQTSALNFFTEIIIGDGGVNSYMGAATKYADVAYWKRKLTTTEISDLYTAFATVSAIENTFTFDYAITDPSPVGSYETYVDQLAPRRWIKCREVYTLSGYDALYDYGSDKKDAWSTANGSNVASIIPQAPAGSQALDVDTGRIEARDLFNANIYTVNFWIKNWEVSFLVKYIFGADRGDGVGAQVYIQNDEIQFYYSFWDDQIDTPATTQMMVTVVSDGNEYNLYVNGQPTGVTPVNGQSALLHAFFNADNDAVSGAPNVQYQDVMIFDKVLSDTEIETLYNLAMFAEVPGGEATVTSIQGSQTTNVPAVNTRPPNYCLSIQSSRRENIVAQKTGANNMHYFATAGLTTTPTSTPAGEVIPPTLKNPGNLYREINLNDFGIVKPSFGEIVIDNLGGAHDDLLTKKIDGLPVKLYRGKRGADFPAGFTQIMTATAAGLSGDYDQIRIKLRDSLEFLDTPVLKAQFAGTGGVQGDSRVTNASKQRHFLYVPYFPPLLIDAQKLIYVCSDNNAVENSSAKWGVYDGGIEIEREADYASLTEIPLLEPSAGKCRMFINQEGGVYLRLGSTPAYDVRVTSSSLTAASVPGSSYFANDVINEIGGLTVSDTGPLLDGRIVIDNDETVAEFLSDFAKSQAYNIWTNQLNEIQIKRFRYNPGAGIADYTFALSDIVSIRLDSIVPAWKVTLNSGEAFPSTLATGADDSIKADLSKTEFMKSVTAEDITVKSMHKLAKSLSISTKAYVSDDAAMLAVYSAIFFSDRQVVTLEVRISNALLALDLNQIVNITIPRFGYNSGKNFVIVALRHDFAQNRLILTLWG